MKRTFKHWSSKELSILNAAYNTDTMQPVKEALKMLTAAGFKRTPKQIRYKANYHGLSKVRAYSIGTTRMKNGNIQEKQPDGVWRWLSHVVLNRSGVEVPTGSVVYHRDGNPLNNDIENLAIKTQSDHCKAITKQATDGRRKHPSVLDMLLQGKTPRLAGNNRMVWD